MSRYVAKPGEFAVRGHKTRSGQVVFDFSHADIPPRVALWLREQFVAPPRWADIPPEFAPTLSLLDDLRRRGARMETFRFSIYQRHRMPCPWPAPRVLRILPNSLRLGWGLDANDRSPDIMGTWSAPAIKRDLHALLRWAQSPLMMNLESAQGRMRFDQALIALGFAIESLKLQVRFT